MDTGVGQAIIDVLLTVLTREPIGTSAVIVANCVGTLAILTNVWAVVALVYVGCARAALVTSVVTVACTAGGVG